MEIETHAVVWSITHFVPYLYVHDVNVLTDHTAVKAILQTLENMPGGGQKYMPVDVKIQYHPGHLNSSAGALSCCPQSPPARIPADSVDPTVAAVSITTSSESTADITTLLSADSASTMPENFADE